MLKLKIHFGNLTAYDLEKNQSQKKKSHGCLKDFYRLEHVL